MTKVDIISGFLGAGKTTFIKLLIENVFAGEKLVLIENEFGEIGIDGGFLKDAGIEITEMNSGCICCTLVGDFSRALQKVIEEYHPDRVLIEPSGVGKLSDVARAVERVKKEAEIEIDGRITIVDGKKAKMYLENFGEFYRDQVAYADTIVMSRTQLMEAHKIEECVKVLREENKEAAIISTPWDKLSSEAIEHAFSSDSQLEGIFEEEECPVCGHHHHHEEECHHGHHHEEECYHEHHHEEGACGCGHEHHHHHHADEVFTSWGQETVKTFTKEQIEGILKKLSEDTAYGMVLRAKGMVAGADGQWIYFDMVPEEYEVRDGAPEFTGRICVIGSKLAEDKLAELFGL